MSAPPIPLIRVLNHDDWSGRSSLYWNTKTCSNFLHTAFVSRHDAVVPTTPAVHTSYSAGLRQGSVFLRNHVVLVLLSWSTLRHRRGKHSAYSPLRSRLHQRAARLAARIESNLWRRELYCGKKYCNVIPGTQYIASFLQAARVGIL